VDIRNQADGMIHNAEKSLKELEGELSAEEKTGIESAVSELKEALKGSDKAHIEEKLKTLTDASGKMAERIYAKKGAEGAASDSAEPSSTESKHNEGVVDAEFEEVKDDKE
jgi:molecular chaperone DnaK